MPSWNTLVVTKELSLNVAARVEIDEDKSWMKSPSSSESSDDSAHPGN